MRSWWVGKLPTECFLRRLPPMSLPLGTSFVAPGRDGLRQTRSRPDALFDQWVFVDRSRQRPAARARHPVRNRQRLALFLLGSLCKLGVSRRQETVATAEVFDAECQLERIAGFT